MVRNHPVSRQTRADITAAAIKQPVRPRLLDVMGPGLITGASDDDPSGIATYPQVGAQFGYGLGWTLLFSYPLMCAIQQVSARIGRVTGQGLAGNLRRHMPPWLTYGVVALLTAANVVNIGADLGAMLEVAGRGSGVEMLLFTDRRWLDRFLPLLLAANAAQMGDAAFLSELKAWIRFGYGDALATRDGLFAGASASPVIPAALGRLLFDMAFTVEGKTKKYARHLRSSADVAVFVAERSDPAGWLDVGRCYQRFALQATELGLRHAFLNQPVEGPTLRADFAALAGVPGRRPDLIVRFGYGQDLPRSLRRPVEQILT